MLWRWPYKDIQQNHTSLLRKWTCLQYAKYPLIQCTDIDDNVDYQNGDHYCDFPWQCNIERDCHSDAPNEQCGFRSVTLLLFETSLGSACSNLMAVSVYGVFGKIARACIDIRIEVLLKVCWIRQPLDKQHTHF